jgi:putative nucleotidyltransferase with HDIG domain
MDKIDQLLEGVEKLPPAPKLLPQLMHALSDMDCDMGSVVDMITFDPALTARLLQMCNSAYFGLARRVASVSEAVSRLGFHEVYHVVAIMSGEKFLRPSHSSGLDAERIWKHAVIAAFASRFVGRGIRADADMLFTAGLLHDIGKVPMAEALKGDYSALVTDVSLNGRTLVALENASFDLNHAEVAGRLLEKWKFSPEFIASVRFHHDCSAAGDFARLAACVEVGDALAHSLVDLKPGEEPQEVVLPEALGVLGLTVQNLSAHQAAILESWESVEKMCRLAR